MSNKLKKHQSLPFRPGNVVLKTYTEDFEDSVGNRAKIDKCDFKDKKGVIHEGYPLKVSWIEDEAFLPQEKKEFIRCYGNFEEEDLSWYDGPVSYFFKFNGALHFAIIGSDYFNYFAFEVIEADRKRITQFKKFEDLAEYLLKSSQSFYRVQHKRFVCDIDLLVGRKAQLSFKRFAQSA